MQFQIMAKSYLAYMSISGFAGLRKLNLYDVYQNSPSTENCMDCINTIIKEKWNSVSIFPIKVEVHWMFGKNRWSCSSGNTSFENWACTDLFPIQLKYLVQEKYMVVVIECFLNGIQLRMWRNRRNDRSDSRIKYRLYMKFLNRFWIGL